MSHFNVDGRQGDGTRRGGTGPDWLVPAAYVSHQGGSCSACITSIWNALQSVGPRSPAASQVRSRAQSGKAAWLSAAEVTWVKKHGGPCDTPLMLRLMLKSTMAPLASREDEWRVELGAAGGRLFADLDSRIRARFDLQYF